MNRKTDYTTFAAELGILAEGLGGTVSVPQIEAYFRALERFEAAQVVAVLNQALTTFKFFPKPVELLELLQGNPQERAERAWAHLLEALADGAGQYHSCQVQDGAAALAIARCWGSLIEAHAAMRELAPNEPMYASQRKAFLGAYTAALREGGEPRYFAGTHELHNRSVSFPRDYEQTVVLLGPKGVARLQMPFSGQTGELQPAAKAALQAADREALRLYLPAKPALQLVEASTPSEAVPMPAEVRALLDKSETGRTALRLVGRQAQSVEEEMEAAA